MSSTQLNSKVLVHLGVQFTHACRLAILGSYIFYALKVGSWTNAVNSIKKNKIFRVVLILLFFSESVATEKTVRIC